MSLSLTGEMTMIIGDTNDKNGSGTAETTGKIDSCMIFPIADCFGKQHKESYTLCNHLQTMK